MFLHFIFFCFSDNAVSAVSPKLKINDNNNVNKLPVRSISPTIKKITDLEVNLNKIPESINRTTELVEIKTSFILEFLLW